MKSDDKYTLEKNIISMLYFFNESNLENSKFYNVVKPHHTITLKHN